MSNFLIGILFYNVLAAIPYLIWRRVLPFFDRMDCTDVIYASLRIASVLFLSIILYGLISEIIKWMHPTNWLIGISTPLVVWADFTLMAGILLGAGYHVVHYFLAEKRIYRIYQKTLIPAEVTLQKRTGEMADLLGVRVDRIQVLEGYAIQAAELAGYVHPLLCIPSDHLPLESTREILLHELVHYKYRDKLFRMAAAISVCIAWFNPVARRILLEVDRWDEFHCDRVVCRYVENLSYAKTLLLISQKMKKWEELTKKDDSGILRTCLLRSENIAVERLERILTMKKNETKKLFVLPALILAMCTAVSVTAYAAEPLVNQAEKKIYQATSLESFDGSDQDEGEEQTMYISPEILAQYITDSSVQRASSTAHFDYDITDNGYHSGAFWASKGQSIYVTAAFNPINITIKVGILQPNGVFRYVTGAEVVQHRFDVNSSGFHQVLVINETTTTVHITGMYTLAD